MIVSSIIILFGFPESDENRSIVNNLTAQLFAPFWIIRLFITFYCFFKSKHFQDYWLITLEFRYLIISLLTVTSCYILGVIAANITKAVLPAPTASYSVSMVIYWGIMVSSCWSIVSTCISVVWVNKMDDGLTQKAIANEAERADRIVSITMNSSDGMRTPDTNTRLATMFNVLTDK